jgi:hypothetical protein
MGQARLLSTQVAPNYAEIEKMLKARVAYLRENVLTSDYRVDPTDIVGNREDLSSNDLKGLGMNNKTLKNFHKAMPLYRLTLRQKARLLREALGALKALQNRPKRPLAPKRDNTALIGLDDDDLFYLALGKAVHKAYKTAKRRP